MSVHTCMCVHTHTAQSLQKIVLTTWDLRKCFGNSQEPMDHRLKTSAPFYHYKCEMLSYPMFSSCGSLRDLWIHSSPMITFLLLHCQTYNYYIFLCSLTFSMFIFLLFGVLLCYLFSDQLVQLHVKKQDICHWDFD